MFYFMIFMLYQFANNSESVFYLLLWTIVLFILFLVVIDLLHFFIKVVRHAKEVLEAVWNHLIDDLTDQRNSNCRVLGSTSSINELCNDSLRLFLQPFHSLVFSFSRLATNGPISPRYFACLEQLVLAKFNDHQHFIFGNIWRNISDSLSNLPVGFRDGIYKEVFQNSQPVIFDRFVVLGKLIDFSRFFCWEIFLPIFEVFKRDRASFDYWTCLTKMIITLDSFSLNVLVNELTAFRLSFSSSSPSFLI